jgi:hypothetical protein
MEKRKEKQNQRGICLVYSSMRMQFFDDELLFCLSVEGKD